MFERRSVGRAAVGRASGLARHSAATAAAAFSLVLLAAMLSQASVAAPAGVRITATPGVGPAGYTMAYTVTNTSPGDPMHSMGADGDASIVEVEIPEISLGDLVFASNGYSAGGVYGWTATESKIPDLFGSALYAGTPAGYVDLATSDYSGSAIEPGQSETFTAQVKTDLTTNAAFAVNFDDEAVAIVDPAIPQSGPAVGVPEPSSFAAFGAALLGMTAFRRRKSEPVCS